MKLHMLDMGFKKYGDCILLVEGDRRILIDGGHPKDDQPRKSGPSIPEQLEQILRHEPPFDISLLVVTHCHSDHIGCLPALVEDDIIRVERAVVADENLGFAGGGQDSVSDPNLQRLLAALREEPRTEFRSRAELEEFLVNSATGEPEYREMLRTLSPRADLTRYRGEDDDAVRSIEHDFADFGLRILGPTRQHLEHCADNMLRDMQEIAEQIQPLTQQIDSFNLGEAYLALVGARSARGGPLDGLDSMIDAGRLGAAVNDQSIIMKVGAGRNTILLTGDMQVAKPQVSGLKPMMDELIATIAEAGPYALVKVAHHASDNAFDKRFFEACGEPKALLISTGRGDSGHPDPEVLTLLKSLRQDTKWARTDKNGLVTASIANGATRFSLAEGRLSNSSPNDVDAAAPLSTPVLQPVAHTVTSKDFVEVTTRIPHVATRVTVTIDVAPAVTTATVRDTILPRRPPSPPDPKPAEPQTDRLVFASGRTLPALLFVTSSRRLVENIGKAETAQVLRAITDAGQQVLDLVNPADPFAEVRAALGGKTGVVIVGGYDVVPSLRYDAIPADLRARLVDANDPDDFVVWSDQIYGDADGDDLGDLPVSRIPDGRSPMLVMSALSAGGGRPTQNRAGILNEARPFAVPIFESLPQPGPMFISAPTTADQIASEVFEASAIYLMLHGHHADTTVFKGDSEDGQIPAVGVGNITRRCSAVVFAGCCWGALPVQTIARRFQPGDPVASLVAEQSIAMMFLKQGALAFIGCTGAHYSPRPPGDYYGGPMHRAFWSHIGAGKGPATALFEAKKDYIAGMPHGRRTPEGLAVEFKTLRGFTCLGLGW